MKSITLSKKQYLLMVAAKVSKRSKRNPPKHVARFIAAVEARS